ncbi:hypothetical protein J4H86_11940 [Spiractinospora alimapuensis]|uniref:sensor histidine kinase n=1 Tax=Spiractinospora alimapuensis TaxID=2820884 RepID=UPI001F46252F|nr:histidine kinase [Spiractinospora alimapuensis]QVQ54324.1 hypothetical protein J4H86_11940 [Spiractinospora alimapuensis]
MSTRWPPVLLDVLVALALSVTFFAPHFRDVARGFPPGAEVDPTGSVLLIACGLAFALRRPWPGLYVGITVAIVFVYTALGHEPGPVFLAPTIALAVCFTTVAPRYWFPILLTCGVGYMIALNWQNPTLGSVLYTAALWFGTGGALALGISLYRNNLIAVTRRAEHAERTREQEAQRQVADERIRIARELHDAVGHRLATISLQAGVANHLAGAARPTDEPDPTQEALAAIRQESTDALRELRTTVGILREHDATEADRAPTDPAPRLEDLRSLVRTMGAAGMELRAELDLSTAEVPDMVAAACYRVVREALTNAARHAPDTPVTLRVAPLPHGLEIDVRNGLEASGGGGGQGVGLLGMRERVTALGGVFEAGPEPSGSFRVWAVLPFDRAVAPPVGAS